MLLGLASGNSFVDTTENTSLAVSPPDIAAVAKQAFYDFGERPIWSEMTVYNSMLYPSPLCIRCSLAIR